MHCALGAVDVLWGAPVHEEIGLGVVAVSVRNAHFNPVFRVEQLNLNVVVVLVVVDRPGVNPISNLVMCNINECVYK